MRVLPVYAFEPRIQDSRILPRRDRETVLVVPDAEAALRRIEPELQVAPFQHLAIMIAENRQQHLAAEFPLGRLPVDVEMLRIGRGRPPLQQVEPPFVVRPSDPNRKSNRLNYSH